VHFRAEMISEEYGIIVYTGRVRGDGLEATCTWIRKSAASAESRLQKPLEVSLPRHPHGRAPSPPRQALVLLGHVLGDGGGPPG